MRHIKLFFLVSVIVSACYCYGARPATTSTYQVIIIPADNIPTPFISINCMKQIYTQFEMNQCAIDKAGDSQRKLDQLLQELQLKYQGKDQGPVLIQIQQDWEILKEKDCLWQKSFSGNGSIAPTLFYLCLFRHNSERIDELKIFLCEGAGLTGPCEASKKYDETNEEFLK